MERYLKTVREVIRKFYYEHHDKIKFEQELATTLVFENIQGGTERNNQIVAMIDASLEKLRKNQNLPHFKGSDGTLARIDELEMLRAQLTKTVVIDSLVPPPSVL